MLGCEPSDLDLVRSDRRRALRLATNADGGAAGGGHNHLGKCLVADGCPYDGVCPERLGALRHLVQDLLARLRCARPASTSLAVASCAICHGWPHGSAAVCCAFLIPKRSIFDVWSKCPNCAPRWGAVSLCIDERLTTSQIVSVQSCVHPCGGRLDGFTASLRLRESLGFVRAWVDVRRAMRVF